MARTKRYRRGWDDGRDLGLKLLVFGVVINCFFLWFFGTPLSLSEWRESEGELEFILVVLMGIRYWGLLTSGLTVLMSLVFLLGPRAHFGDGG